MVNCPCHLELRMPESSIDQISPVGFLKENLGVVLSDSNPSILIRG